MFARVGKTGADTDYLSFTGRDASILHLGNSDPFTAHVFPKRTHKTVHLIHFSLALIESEADRGSVFAKSEVSQGKPGLQRAG